MTFSIGDRVRIRQGDRVAAGRVTFTYVHVGTEPGVAVEITHGPSAGHEAAFPLSEVEHID